MCNIKMTMFQILKDCIETLIDCPKLSLVCPESMRYIIRLKVAPNKVWNTVIKWVQYKGIYLTTILVKSFISAVYSSILKLVLQI